MKNLLGLCAAILFCGSAFGFESVPRLHEDWWKQKFERNRKMIAESGGTFDIVMLGDSITHYWEVGEGRDESRDIEILERKYKMLNCGYGGGHIENLLWRVRNGELDGYKARLVTLMIGTNNYADPVERIAEGVRVVLEEIRQRQPTAKVLLMAYLPRGKERGNKCRAKVEAANELLRPMADGQKVIWADFGGLFLNEDGTTNPKMLDFEYLHPSTEGYRAWREALEPILERLVPTIDAAKELFGEGDFFIGCNYWARHAGMYMWSKWRPDIVEKEVAALAEQGVKVMRVFPLWSDFQPMTGDCSGGGQYRSYRLRDNRPLPNPAGVDDEMVKRFAWFCDCAERHGVRLVVGLVTGWMSGRQFVPSVFEEKDVLVDPEAVMWQTRYVKYLVTALKGKRAIAAWDLGNECNCMGGKTQAAFYNWMDHIGMAIRLADPTRPVVSGMHGLSTCESSRCPIRLNGELMDILCTHPYSFYVPGCAQDPFNTMRVELHPTAESLLYRQLGGKPCFIEEVGNIGTSCNSETRTAAGTRVMLFSAWANDLKGLLWWCNSDQENLEFPPYDLTAYERELGLLRDDYSPKPVMAEMREFQRFRKSLPFTKLPRRKSNAVIVVPEKMAGWPTCFGVYLLCRQAGIDPDFAGAENNLPDSRLYVVCSSEDEQAYTYSAQKRVFARAREDGATVLVIYGSMNRFTRLAEVTGLEVDYCTKASCTRTFSLAESPDCKMTCDDSWTCRLRAKGAEIQGETTDGEPAFTRFALGKGQVFVINSPVDRAAIARTDVFQGEKIVPYYKMFRAVAAAASLKRTVVKGDCPQVVFTEHPADNGRMIIVAVNCEPRLAECPIRIDGTLGTVWRGDVTAERIRLTPNEAAVFEILMNCHVAGHSD